MAPVVAEIALENRNTFAVAKLNIKNARQTLQKYPLRATPHYIVFQDGKAVDGFWGVQPKARMVQRILNVIEVE